MKQLNKFQNFLFQAGGILLLAGAVMPLFTICVPYAPYVFTIGAILFSTMQMMSRYEGQNPVIKRLRRQQLLGALLLLVSGGMMFTSLFRVGPFQKDEWLVVLAIATVFEAYTAFRIPAMLEKEEK